jgi:hypothetical protein
VSGRSVVASLLGATVFVACTAIAAAAVERSANAHVSRRTISVHGKPFFPVMLIDQCTRGEAAHARRLGINLILNEGCPRTPPKRQLAMVSNRQLVVLPIKQRTARGGHLAGWTFPDEPDNNGWTPATLARKFAYRRGNADGLLSFMTLTGRFFRPPYRNTSVGLATIGRFARLADVAGFDLYPLNACQHDLSAVYDAQRQFTRLAQTMPTFQWIETGPIRPTYCGGFAMRPAELTAEAWLAVAGGARGIGFFTHTWTPTHNAFDVAPGVQRALAHFAQLASAVKPGLVGKTILSGSTSAAVKLVARKGDGRTYVFAVNSGDAPVTAQLHVPRLRAGRLTVFGEKRTVTVVKDRFVDRFQPLAVHVYVQRR